MNTWTWTVTRKMKIDVVRDEIFLMTPARILVADGMASGKQYSHFSISPLQCI